MKEDTNGGLNQQALDMVSETRTDDDSDDEELDQLVREVFEIILSYDDEDRLEAVRRLVGEYGVRKFRQGAEDMTNPRVAVEI